MKKNTNPINRQGTTFNLPIDCVSCPDGHLCERFERSIKLQKMCISAMATYMMFEDKAKADVIMVIVQKGVGQRLERTDNDEN